MTHLIDAVVLFWMSQAIRHPDTRAVHTCAMAQHDDFDRQAWLDALNARVKMGLVEVVSLAEDGEPSFRLGVAHSRRANLDLDHTMSI